MFNEMKMEQMQPLIEESIKNGGNFTFYPKGTSMLPTIIPGKDTVKLCELAQIKKYDILLYKRKNGQYIMHRIVKTKYFPKTNGIVFTMCGDNQVIYEHGITPDMLIAKVKSIIKPDGTEIPCTGEQNRKYAEKLRLKKLPGRFKHGIKTMLYPFYKAVFKRR